MESKIYAIGDIHGCIRPFRVLLEDEIRPGKDDKIILLGDYVDRGSDSKAVVDYIIELQKNEYDIIPLKGNHEVMLLESTRSEISLLNWLYNGGGETLKSYDIYSIAELDKVYIDFYNNLPYYYSLGDYYFVHAGFNDDIENPFEDKYHMIWKYREKYDHPVFKNKTIVHGHFPVRKIKITENEKNNSTDINVDSGCVYTETEGYGMLSAIELNSMQIFSVNNLFI
ncbi:metallophosphoesterase family protein [Bacteroidota bacterium]